jgi:hypothetical protein
MFPARLHRIGHQLLEVVDLGIQLSTSLRDLVFIVLLSDCSSFPKFATNCHMLLSKFVPFCHSQPLLKLLNACACVSRGVVNYSPKSANKLPWHWSCVAVTGKEGLRKYSLDESYTCTRFVNPARTKNWMPQNTL